MVGGGGNIFIVKNKGKIGYFRDSFIFCWCEKIDCCVNIYINGKFEVGGLMEINWNCGIVWILL